MINTPIDLMWRNCATTVKQFGLDQTGEIEYRFNSQGFRGNRDYNFIPDYAIFGCSIAFGIGVPWEKTIAGHFDQIHNYGLASNYNNSHCFTIIKQFLNSEWFRPTVKMAVIWTDRDQTALPEYVGNLQEHPMIHLFCGDCPTFPNCYKFIPNLDQDISNTHPGPDTHKFIYRSLCQLFNQL